MNRGHITDLETTLGLEIQLYYKLLMTDLFPVSKYITAHKIADLLVAENVTQSRHDQSINQNLFSEQ